MCRAKAYDQTFWKMGLPTVFSWAKEVWSREAWKVNGMRATNVFRGMINGMIDKMRADKRKVKKK